MANNLPKLFLVDLNDSESGKTYTISVTSGDIKRLETDADLVKLKLSEAKDLEYAQFISGQDAETIEESDPNDTLGESISESNMCSSENSAFKWAHEAILLLLDEYRKQETNFTSGKITQKKLWERISLRLQAHGHNITGPQCQSKFSGMKKTYKKTKDHNNKSGNSAKHWPYFTLMDELMGNKPFISPLATCSSTGKKRTLSESSSESSTSTDWDNVASQKKAKITAANQLLTALEERAVKNEENQERRFKQFMTFKAQKAEDALECKNRALDLLEKISSSNNKF